MRERTEAHLVNALNAMLGWGLSDQAVTKALKAQAEAMSGRPGE